MAKPTQVEDPADISKISAEEAAELRRMYNVPSSEEQSRTEDLEALKNKQRRQKKIQKAARIGGDVARLAGYDDLADILDEGAEVSGQHHGDSLAGRAVTNKLGAKAAGYGRNAANKWGAEQTGKAALAGEKVGKAADVASKMGGGSEAAMAGAIAGALRGEGVGGVAKSAWSTWVLWFAFGFLGLSVIFSPTIITIFTAAIALIYLDFHWLMSKLGSKVFGRMNVPQQVTLYFANLVVVAIPFIFITLFSLGACDSTVGGNLAKAMHYGSFGYFSNYCNMSSTTPNTNTSTANPTGSDEEAQNRRLLASYGITVNKECVDRTRQISQTCVGAMKLTTLYEVINMMQACDTYTKTITPGDMGAPDNRCGVRITGGNEPGHESGTCSHANGYKIDIGLTDQLEQYIRQTSAFKAISNRGSDPRYVRNIGGAVYARESNHWDIVAGCT